MNSRFKILFSLLITIGIIGLSSISAYSQLTEYEDFFKDRGKEYKKWLKTNGLDQILKYESINVEDDRVTVNLVCPHSYAWLSLSEKVNKENAGGSLQFMLWNELMFLGELKPEESSVAIEGKDIIIYIDFIDDKLVADIQRKMSTKIKEDEAKDDVLKVEKSELSITGLSGVPKQSSNVIASSKANIEKDLEEYFKNFEAKFSLEDYSFEEVSYGKNNLKIVIKNIKNAVYDGQFEYIVFSFLFSEQNEELIINYSIGCKYGGGILWSPRNSEYKDGWSKYPNQTREFCENMKGKIYKILTQTR